MRAAIDKFQKTLFTLILFLSGFSGIISDMMESSKTGFLLAFDIIIIVLALTSLSTIRGKLGIILFFISGCIIFNLTYNGNGLMASLNGLREISNLLCLVIFFNHLFSEGNEELVGEYIYIIKRFAIIFLFVQIPVSAYQFSIHGPSDWVGGTYGPFGSGNLTLVVICLVFFLSHFTENLTQKILLYVSLVPLFLNETKVSFILIPLLILFIHFKPKLKSIITATLASGVALVIFNSLFTTNIGIDLDNSLLGIFNSDFIDNYLFGDIYTFSDVPRFTKIILAYQILSEDTITLLFGLEYGIFRQTDIADTTQVAQNLEWLMVGTRPYLFFLIVQGGILLIVGVMWLILYINKYFLHNNNKYKTFLFLLFALILFYNDALRSQNFCLVYLFSVFYSNSDLYARQFQEE